MSAITLYRNPWEIHLVQIDHGIRNTNLALNRSDFVVYKGVTSNVEFVVRNNDRKPIPLVGKNLICNMTDHFSGETVLARPLYVFDAHKGKVRLSLRSTDLDDLHIGYYRYSILMRNEDDSEEVLFVDQNLNARGVMEIKEGVVPKKQPSLEIDMEPNHLSPFPFGDPPVTRYTTGPYGATGRSGNDEGLHTIAIYLDDWTGKFWLQGTLTEDPPTLDSDWFNIDLGQAGEYLSFCKASGIEAFNFMANLSWLRIVIEPDAVLNDGCIEKVLIKN